MSAWNFRACSFRSTLLIGVAVLATPAMAQTQSQSKEGSSGLKDIVVTAQRREESLQDVPIAVTALTDEDLRKYRVQNARDLTALAPGLNVGASPGGSQSSALTLRGIYSTPAYAGQNGGISVYLDGVYLGSNVGQFFDLADIERIEVLRGPQGTLFGRNSTGGAISITSRQPSGAWGGRVEASLGNYDQRRFKARVDLPAFGPVSASLTYLHNERRGDIRNLGAGTKFDFGPATDGNYGIRTGKKYLGDLNVDAFVGQVKIEASPDLTLNYKFDYTDQHYSDNGQGVVNFGYGGVGNSAFTIGIAQALYFSMPEELRTPIGTLRPKAVNNAMSTGAHLKIQGHSLTADWQASDSLSFKNILSYRKLSSVWTTDVTGFGFTGLTPPANIFGLALPDNVTLGELLGGGDYLATLIAVTGNSHHKQFSEEFQATYSSDLFDLTAGALYYWERSESRPQLNNDPRPTGPLSGLVFAQPFQPGDTIEIISGPVQNDLYGFGLSQMYQTSSVKSWSAAFYAQAAIHLTDQIDLILGGRETIDRKHGIDALSSAGVWIEDDNLHYRAEKFTWLVGLNYEVTPDILLYAKASSGFISGGQLGGQTYDAETAKSYEAGVKADLLDRHARINLAVYHATYGALQFPTTIPSDTGGTLNAILNYGDAKATGFELEATLIPVRGITLNGNVGYTDFSFRGEIDPRAVNGLETQPYAVLPASRPKWTAALAAQYDTPELPWGGHVYVRGEANYKGAHFSSPRGYDDNGDGAFNSSDETWKFIRRPDYWILNARLAATKIPVGPLDAEVAVWGRNLSNNRSLQFMSWLSFGYHGSFERARTYGLDLTVDF